MEANSINLFFWVFYHARFAVGFCQNFKWLSCSVCVKEICIEHSLAKRVVLYCFNRLRSDYHVLGELQSECFCDYLHSCAYAKNWLVECFEPFPIAFKIVEICERGSADDYFVCRVQVS